MSDEQKDQKGELTDEQLARLNQLETSIGLEAVTVSFSIEDRDAGGRRKSAFNSIRAHRADGIVLWTMEEAKIVACILSKQVVAATYRDAVVRGFMASSTANEEVRGIVAHYQANIVKLLQKRDDDEG